MAAPQRLTNSLSNDEQPSWSPNGSQIAFISIRDDGLIGELYVMNQDGSDPQRLTDNDFYENDPVWSPDGDRIAFTLSLWANPKYQRSCDLFIWRLPAQNHRSVGFRQCTRLAATCAEPRAHRLPTHGQQYDFNPHSM